MTLQDVLPRLRDPKPDGKGGWWAFCPCHNDGAKRGRRSLRITEKDGKVLLYCFAGCEFKNIVAELGLKAERHQEEPEAIYSYTNESGKLLFEVLRFPGKRFVQRRPDGAGGWVYNLKGVRRVLYRLPEVLAAVNENRTVFIVEGEKDADNLARLGLAATTVPGGAGKWRQEYSEVLRGADVVVLPDNDEPGHKHAEQVAKSLHGVAARVRVLELPGLPEKGDVSDWLAAGGTKEELLQLAAEAPEWGQAPEQEPDSVYSEWFELFKGTEYTVSGGYLCHVRETKEGRELRYLANFIARPVREIFKDDGATTEINFEIEGLLAGGRPLPSAVVPASRFASLSWISEKWGLEANIEPGTTAKDRIRHAIQSLARSGVERKVVYTHIGWRRIGGKWCYLHAGGAVGAEGVLVEPDSDSLKRYVLPVDGSVEESMRASLRLLEIAPPEMILPLWAAVWRAPTACLLYPTLTLWPYGSSGALKSTKCALVLSHFGGPFDKDNLPGSWLSTDNALERLAFLCRDALLVIDDYAPEVHRQEAAVLERRVNRLIRQIGNRQARGRLYADLRQRPDFIPNCLLISTGEQLPLGVGSVAARILPVPFDREKIDLARLTAAQAEAHLLPQAMRGYLQWLAPQMDTLVKTLPERFRELRSKATVEGHARLPEAVAHLQVGMELGLRYAVEVGVLGEKEAQEWENLSWITLLTLAREHGKLLEEERPVVKFLHTLDAIFTTGHGHLRQRVTGEKGEFGTDGDLLGWYDADGLYLIPEAGWRAVQEYLRASGGFPIRERTLRDALLKEEILEPDEKSGKKTRVEWCENKSRRVLTLKRSLYDSLLEKGVRSVSGAEDADAVPF
ncbi:MAG: DUF927 domain-containing protein [Bacillota bacterium]